MLRDIKIDLVYQGQIDRPPPQAGDLYARACSSDQITVDSWRSVWTKNYGLTKERFGKFSDHSIGQLYGINRQRPAIVIGSGPSLKHSIAALKENANESHPVLTVSCLHNFGYFEDEGFHADYYLSIDSGKIVVDDVSEGRKLPASEYWEKTKGKKLLAYVGSDPSLFELWQGEVYLFNCLLPDLDLRAEFDRVERFSHYVSCGGNALGGCMYIAKAIFGSSAIHYVGADFCFDHDNTFHSYQTHYDQLGQFIPWRDVFGLPRKTWQSYLNFKFWFDHIAMTVPGRWVNCSEGLLGSYPEGNLKHFEYTSLRQALTAYWMTERVFEELRDDKGVVLEKNEIKLKELFSNSQFEKDILLF